jgi:hypothetical protein
MEETKMEKPYTQFLNDFKKPSFEKVLRAVDAGEYGKQVKFSVFGIGSFDPSYDLSSDRIKEITKSMKFYAKVTE